MLVRDLYSIGIILHYFSKEIPFLALIILAVLRAQPMGYDLIAENLGANRWQRLRYVTIPLVMPSLLRPPSLLAAKFMGVSTLLNGDQLTVKNEASSLSEKIFAIRPEHIRIQKDACKNSMQGVVSDCVFRGEYFEYQVDVNDATARAYAHARADVSTW